jgi:hypothetical protein
MPIEIKKEIELEIAHVLFIDIVGYTKLSISDQHAAIEELNQVVRASEQFRRAEAATSNASAIPTHLSAVSISVECWIIHSIHSAIKNDSSAILQSGPVG